MCGIVGYTGSRTARSVLVPALRRLEYRGYDSAGIATLNGHGVELRKSVGKIAALEEALAEAPPEGRVGIAHTRWATHGRPTEANAHPHLDCSGRIAIVHNGIIDNYQELRRELSGQGHRFRSGTDSEVIAHLIERYHTGDLVEAVRLAVARLKGGFAAACIAEDRPDTVIAFRTGGTPLVVGRRDGETFLASDIPALLGETDAFLVLGENEMAVLTPDDVRLATSDGRAIVREVRAVSWSVEDAEKGGYPHFMLKEIYEQPESVRQTIGERVNAEAGVVAIPELEMTEADARGLHRVQFIACGTSWHASLVGKYLIEALARLPVDVELASEFLHRRPVIDSRVLTVPVSQSGETADALLALKAAREQGSRSIAICNVVGSSMTREAEGVLYTRAGLEIGVASTKAFTAQLAAMTMLAVKLGVERGFLEADEAGEILRALHAIPASMERCLGSADRVKEIAATIADRRDALFLGRGLGYPLALEGALKLKEVSYVHAEGYAAGEMKHGPIALVDSRMPVVALTPEGPTHAKMASNIEEVRAREGHVIAIATEGDASLEGRADEIVTIPRALPWVQPLLLALPLQLLAYHTGVLRGCDVDQPRNLAKSVTVE
jgi:glucosamine--fructose-6-phosphate aminotransferase (isomerizing)